MFLHRFTEYTVVSVWTLLKRISFQEKKKRTSIDTFNRVGSSWPPKRITIPKLSSKSKTNYWKFGFKKFSRLGKILSKFVNFFWLCLFFCRIWVFSPIANYKILNNNWWFCVILLASKRISTVKHNMVLKTFRMKFFLKFSKWSRINRVL